MPALSGINSQPLTFSDLKDQVGSISKFLKNEGISEGDRVAILSENLVNWAIAYFAITTMGAVAVPIMQDFPAADIQHILRHSQSKAIFISSKLYHKIEDPEFTDLQTYILIDDFSIIPPYTKSDVLKEAIKTGKRGFAKIKERALKIAGINPPEIKEDNIASLLYTSGTTGHSKGVMLTHKNIVSDAIATSKIVEIGKGDRLLSILPLPHTYECTLGLCTALMAGACIYYLDRPPTPAILIPAMAKVRPTLMLSVPLVIEKIYRAKIKPRFMKGNILPALYRVPLLRKKLNQAAGRKLIETFGGVIHMFCLGGAPLAPEVERFLKESGFPYCIGYGLTETSPLVTGTDPAHVRLESAGKALPGVEISVLNPGPLTGIGEILVKGPNVMKGYYKAPELTEECFTKDGWFRTGDLGYIDEEGYLFIRGRSKNVIIGPSGENIYPEQVESVLNDMLFVSESLVYERGGQLYAKLYLNYDEIEREFNIRKMKEPDIRKKIDSILESLLKEANTRLAKFSRLKSIAEQQEPFEKTPTQKIKRYLYI